MPRNDVICMGTNLAGTMKQIATILKKKQAVRFYVCSTCI